MARKYVKAYFDWGAQMAALSDAEKGRLFMAILEYGQKGRAPELQGREGILFPVFQSQIDRDEKNYQTYVTNGRNGGAPIGNSNAAKTTKNNQEQPTDKKTTKNKQDKDQDQDQDQDQVVVVGKGIVSKEKKERPTTTTPALRASVGVSVDGLEKIVNSYEACIGPIPRHVAEDAAGWISQGMDPELICKALELAAENNVRRWAYVQGILRNCQAGGISTLPAFLSREAERARDATEGARKPGAAEAQSKWPEL